MPAAMAWSKLNSQVSIKDTFPVSAPWIKKIAAVLRRAGRTHGHRLPGRGVWFLGLAVFLTSVTIAAIIPRDDSALPAGGGGPSVPPPNGQPGGNTRSGTPPPTAN